MTCSACGDKPVNKSCDTCGKLPPVLQINSKECPVLFHTVEVDGTYEENPPYIGQYKNVLLVFRGDGAKFLFSSDGVPTALSGAMEFNSLIGRPKYAGEEMTSETNIPDVEAAVAAEASIRENADAELTAALNAESEARTQADTALQTEVSALDTSLSELDSSLATVAKTGSYNDLTDKPVIDSNFSDSSENAVQNKVVTTALDKDVVTELEVNPNPSTSVVQLDTTKTNLRTSSTTTNNVPLPVASAAQAGVMNSAMYNALTKNTQDIANIIGEVVAITGLPDEPTQAELTTAWLNASGESTLINGAGIYDVTNAKRWTYYTNDTTWHSLDASGSVEVNTFTNDTAGIIKGSTNSGQVFAENDGTGSVNGWDVLSAQVGDNTSKLSTIEQGAQVNIQSNWTESDTTSDAYIANKPALSTVATSGSYDDLTDKPTIDSALSNTSTNAVENKAIDTEFEKVAYIGEDLSTPSSVAYVAEDNIQTNAVTTDKIADGAVTSHKIDFTTLPQDYSGSSQWVQIGDWVFASIVFSLPNPASLAPDAELNYTFAQIFGTETPPLPSKAYGGIGVGVDGNNHTRSVGLVIRSNGQLTIRSADTRTYTAYSLYANLMWKA